MVSGVSRARRWGAVSTVLVLLLGTALVWFALRADGDVVRKTDLFDGGVWVTNAEQARFGRLNKPAGQLDAGIASPGTQSSGLDVVQDGAAVLGVSKASNQLLPINPRTATLSDSSQITLPAPQTAAEGLHGPGRRRPARRLRRHRRPREGQRLGAADRHPRRRRHPRAAPALAEAAGRPRRRHRRRGRRRRHGVCGVRHQGRPRDVQGRPWRRRLRRPRDDQARLHDRRPPAHRRGRPLGRPRRRHRQRLVRRVPAAGGPRLRQWRPRPPAGGPRRRERAGPDRYRAPRRPPRGRPADHARRRPHGGGHRPRREPAGRPRGVPARGLGRPRHRSGTAAPARPTGG